MQWYGPVELHQRVPDSTSKEGQEANPKTGIGLAAEGIVAMPGGRSKAEVDGGRIWQGVVKQEKYPAELCEVVILFGTRCRRDSIVLPARVAEKGSPAPGEATEHAYGLGRDQVSR